MSPLFADAPTQRLEVFQIDTEGKSPAQIGTELGHRWKQRFPDLERRYDIYLAGRFSQQTFDRLLDERVVPLRAGGIDRAYLDELRGLSSALNLIGSNRLGDGYLSMDELWFAQLLPDLGGYGRGCGFGVYGSRAGGSGTLVGRNLDRVGDALSALTAITVYASPERTLVNIGAAGTLGIITGFNDQGLFLAYLDAPLAIGRQPSSTDERAIGFALRRVLEDHDNTATAVNTLMRSDYGNSHSVLLADPKRVQVLEQPRGGASRLRKPLSPTRTEMAWEHPEQIAAVDCFALPATSANCRELRDRYRWQRLRALARFDPQGPRAEIPDLARIMLDRADRQYAIFGEETRQAMVFAPRSASLYLHTRAGPGGDGEEPVMHRYADLTADTVASASGPDLFLVSLWILAGIMLVATVWVRFRRSS